MNRLTLSVLSLTLLASLRLQAQLPADAGALKIGDLPPGAVGIRIEDSSRTLKDEGSAADLDMLRVTASMRLQLIPGVYPWVEAGWHDPELGNGKSSGGFTWGAGLHTRPLLKPLRMDPAIGPRDWLALTVDLAVRSGEADANAGKIDWINFEGVVGAEWHKTYLGRHQGPMGAHDITAGAGVVFNSLEGDQGSFGGSEEQAVGIRLRTGFSFRNYSYINLEGDLYGSSDRRLSLVAGIKF